MPVVFLYALQLKEHIIKRLFAIRATNLQTILQLSSVLKEATAFSDVEVSPESMVIFHLKMHLSVDGVYFLIEWY